MSLEIVPLGEEHLEDAALLVTARYRKLRQDVPSLPSRHEDVISILPLLSDLASETPAVAAIRGGRLARFLLGLFLPDFRGKRAAYSPEWANAAKGEDSGEIYREMYAQLSAHWVDDGCSLHAVTLLANDREGIEGWHWLGFGLTAVDAVRDLTPLQGTAAGVDIRRARLENIEEVMALDQALQRHLAAGPIFLLMDEEHDREYYEQWLADPANVMWLAYLGAEVVACMGLGPPDACYIIEDEKTVSIEPAFTKEGVQKRGIATALLAHSLDWARAAGYERCAVDFEPENVPATRFWLRHFQPVCYSLIRRVDERVM
jgi:GNAT superfamily N-acetyltransferase